MLARYCDLIYLLFLFLRRKIIVIAMNKKVSSNNFAFLSPYMSIRSEHLSKRDVLNIKLSLGFKIGVACLLAATAMLIVDVILFVILGSQSKFDIIGVYGLNSLVGLIVSTIGSFTCLVLELISIRTKSDKVKNATCRIGHLILFMAIAAQMILYIHADAAMGYLSYSETVSAAVLLVAILMLIQPVFWSEAIILDLLVSGSVIFIALHSHYEHGLQAVYYYIMLAIVYLFACYLISSILFYAETQRYCQVLRNERLYNTAIYDELTQCKNRYALREFLKNNHRRWETKQVNILMIMFDIDNFKEYNDQFSHPGGDYCLRSVADAVRKEFQSPNLDFFRYGGEEFILFLEIRNVKDSKKLILQVRNAVKGLKIEAPEGAPKDVVTISVGGLTIVTPIDFNFEEHIRTVDKYLYKAKEAGKDVCCLDDKIVK